MILIEDKGQKSDKHNEKNAYWDKQGIDVQRFPLPIGDYVIANEKVLDVIKRKQERGVALKKMDFLGAYNVCVDTKKDIYELVNDICGKDHDRFRDECMLAQNNGVQLYILVENQFEVINLKKDIYNKPIYELQDLHKWINKRLWIRDPKTKKQKYPHATKGVTLMKACMTIAKKYGVKFFFCHNREAGYIVLRLLTTGGK